MSRVSDLRPHPDGYGYDELKPLASAALRAGLSVLLRGHPGVGKSTLACELAEKMGLPVHDIRLAQREPAELGGIYMPDRDRRTLELLAPDWVRAVCDAPGFVFLDEINAAVTRLHQAAAYQIVLERRVGPFRFHPQTVVMAAGNLDDDEALVTPLSSALNNRFVHLKLRVDAAAWLRWGETAGIHPAVLGYIGSRGSLGAQTLYEMPSSEDAFPTPRSWEMASRLLVEAGEGEARRLVAACIGMQAAEKFHAYLRIHRRFDPRAVVERGKKVEFNATEPSFIYAAVYAVADHLGQVASVPDKHLPNIAKFLASPGLDPELRFLFLRRIRAAGDLLTRLKTQPEYRALAEDLVDLHLAVMS